MHPQLILNWLFPYPLLPLPARGRRSRCAGLLASYAQGSGEGGVNLRFVTWGGGFTRPFRDEPPDASRGFVSYLSLAHTLRPYPSEPSCAFWAEAHEDGC
jgi:hypothetical protein